MLMYQKKEELWHFHSQCVSKRNAENSGNLRNTKWNARLFFSSFYKVFGLSDAWKTLFHQPWSGFNFFILKFPKCFVSHYLLIRGWLFDLPTLGADNQMAARAELANQRLWFPVNSHDLELRVSAQRTAFHLSGSWARRTGEGAGNCGGRNGIVGFHVLMLPFIGERRRRSTVFRFELIRAE